MFNFLFPRYCVICHHRLMAAEPWICLHCSFDLPLACHHRTGDPAMCDRFYGRVPIAAATALLEFQKAGPTQQLLHQIKYKGLQSLGAHLGDWLGSELAQHDHYRDTDVVLPVPLHPKKRRKRGYNQVRLFARQIATHLGCTLREDILQKQIHTRSFVFQGRGNRSMSENPFSVKKGHELENKRILVVDDILTTGTTLEHCATRILEHHPKELRVATMAIA